MVSIHSGTIAWAWTACGSTDSPDAFQVKLGAASGVYSVCACYASTILSASLRSILTTSGTYYGVVIPSLQTTALCCTTEFTLTVCGKSIMVG